MSQPKNHHYLPKFYLKRWTGADSRVFRYYRPEKHPDGSVVASRVGPEYTGCEERLYELPGTENPQIVETDFLSPVDDGAACVLSKMLDGGLESLGEDDRRKWTLFLMSLRLRIPQALRELESSVLRLARVNCETSIQAEYAASRQPDDPLSVVDYAMQQTPDRRHVYKASLPLIIDCKEIGERIMNMRWAIIDLSTAKLSLLTGDRPLMTSSGLNDRQCILSLPVSPMHLFVAAFDEQRICQVTGQQPRDTVRNLNSCTARMAVENVYGCSPDHLRFVENRLRKKDAPIDLGLFGRRGTDEQSSSAGGEAI